MIIAIIQLARAILTYIENKLKAFNNDLTRYIWSINRSKKLDRFDYFLYINWRDSCSIESQEVVRRLHQPSIGFLIISVPNYISFLCFNDVLLLSKIPFTSCPKNTFYMHDLLLWPVRMKVFTVPEQLFVEMILDCSSNLGTLDVKRRTCLRFHTIQIYTYRNKTYLKAVMFWHTLYISNVLS